MSHLPVRFIKYLLEWASLSSVSPTAVSHLTMRFIKYLLEWASLSPAVSRLTMRLIKHLLEWVSLSPAVSRLTMSFIHEAFLSMWMDLVELYRVCRVLLSWNFSNHAMHS